MDCCVLFEQIKKARSLEIIVFEIWFCLAFPDLLNDSPENLALSQLGKPIDPNNKGEFADIVDPVKRKARGIVVPEDLLGMVPIPPHKG